STHTSLHSFPTRRSSDLDSSAKAAPFVETQVKEGVVPDVLGMGLSDAIFTMENAGFKTKVSGWGKVVSQSLVAGTKLKVGTPIRSEEHTSELQSRENLVC